MMLSPHSLFYYPVTPFYCEQPKSPETDITNVGAPNRTIEMAKRMHSKLRTYPRQGWVLDRGRLHGPILAPTPQLVGLGLKLSYILQIFELQFILPR